MTSDILPGQSPGWSWCYVPAPPLHAASEFERAKRCAVAFVVVKCGEVRSLVVSCYSIREKEWEREREAKGEWVFAKRKETIEGSRKERNRAIGSGQCRLCWVPHPFHFLKLHHTFFLLFHQIDNFEGELDLFFSNWQFNDNNKKRVTVLRVATFVRGDFCWAASVGEVIFCELCGARHQDGRFHSEFLGGDGARKSLGNGGEFRCGVRAGSKHRRLDEAARRSLSLLRHEGSGSRYGTLFFPFFSPSLLSPFPIHVLFKYRLIIGTRKSKFPFTFSFSLGNCFFSVGNYFFLLEMTFFSHWKWKFFVGIIFQGGFLTVTAFKVVDPKKEKKHLFSCSGITIHIFLL